MLNPTPRRKERGPRLAKFSLLKGATAAGSHICSEEQKRDRHFRGLHKVTGTGPLSWRSSDVAVESSASRRWNHALRSGAPPPDGLSGHIEEVSRAFARVKEDVLQALAATGETSPGRTEVHGLEELRLIATQLATRVMHTGGWICWRHNAGAH